MVGISKHHFDDDTKDPTKSSLKQGKHLRQGSAAPNRQSTASIGHRKTEDQLREIILAAPVVILIHNFDLAMLFTEPLQIFHAKESMMSILKIARPVAIATLLALGVGAAGSAYALTGIKSQHGPCELQSKDQQGPTCPPDKR